jgi:hypothetical protein
MRNYQKALALAFFLGMICPVFGQGNFNYSFAQSTSTYTDISAGTTLFPNMAWDEEEAAIPIGFSFSFLGSSFDTVNINTDGFLFFDEQYQHVGAASYQDLYSKQLSNNEMSTISYQLEGTAGTQLLKIEFKNCAVYEGTGDDAVNFQIWLHESDNSIEYHYGNHQISDPATAYDENGGPQIGLMNLDISDAQTQSGLILNGSPSAAGSAIRYGATETFLGGTPDDGTIFKFTPL